jgi:hypothetical protein
MHRFWEKKCPYCLAHVPVVLTIPKLHVCINKCNIKIRSLLNKSLELIMVGNGRLMSEQNISGSDKSVSPHTNVPISSFSSCWPWIYNKFGYTTCYASLNCSTVGLIIVCTCISMHHSWELKQQVHFHNINGKTNWPRASWMWWALGRGMTACAAAPWVTVDLASAASQQTSNTTQWGLWRSSPRCDGFETWLCR